MGRSGTNVGRGKLVSGGRLQMPARVRYRDALARVQKRLRKYVPKDVLLSDELIADRRAESDRE